MKKADQGLLFRPKVIAQREETLSYAASEFINMSQRSKVVDLYKRMLYLGRDWPAGYDFFRTRCHRAFLKNKDETDQQKIEKMVAHGEYVVKEMEALYMLKKYRTLKRRYYDQP